MEYIISRDTAFNIPRLIVSRTLPVGMHVVEETFDSTESGCGRGPGRSK